MIEAWGGIAIIAGSVVVIIGMFVRVEHRLTKVEVLVTVIAGKLGICLPNSEKDTK